MSKNNNSIWWNKFHRTSVPGISNIEIDKCNQLELMVDYRSSLDFKCDNSWNWTFGCGGIRYRNDFKEEEKNEQVSSIIRIIPNMELTEEIVCK